MAVRCSVPASPGADLRQVPPSRVCVCVFPHDSACGDLACSSDVVKGNTVLFRIVRASVAGRSTASPERPQCSGGRTIRLLIFRTDGSGSLRRRGQRYCLHVRGRQCAHGQQQPPHPLYIQHCSVWGSGGVPLPVAVFRALTGAGVPMLGGRHGPRPWP